MCRVIVGMCSLVLAVAAWGQESQPPANPLPCQEVAAAGDFDFWLGSWEVTTADGTVAGTNRISKEDGGCLVLERWTSSAGGTGTSVNFFNPESNQWRQVWVGSGGSLIDIVGGLRDGSMTLTGTIVYVGRRESFPFRGTWTPLEDGRVRQFFEQFDADRDSWQPWFEGFYRRLDEP